MSFEGRGLSKMLNRSLWIVAMHRTPDLLRMVAMPHGFNEAAAN
jgi:hypothetical protein